MANPQQIDGKTPGELWAEQAQHEAEREILTCRACNKSGSIDEGITIWRNGKIVYGIGDCCLHRFDFLISATERGIEIRGKSRGPIVVRTK
jgi:hypothetical protein